MHVKRMYQVRIILLIGGRGFIRDKEPYHIYNALQAHKKPLYISVLSCARELMHIEWWANEDK